MKKLSEAAFGILVLCAFSFLMAYTLINWALGCGESFPRADGSRIQGECINVLEMFHVEQGGTE